MKNVFYILITVTLFIYGCESTVQNFHIEDPDPKLAVYTYAGLDSSLKVFVSRNMSLNETQGLYPQVDALVELYDGDELVSIPMVGKDSFFIDTSFNFKKNKNYTVQVSKDGYNSTESSFYVPDNPVVYSIDTTVSWYTQPGCPDCSAIPNVRFTIRFENPPETKDYFSIEIISSRIEYLWNNNSPSMEDPDTFLNKYRIYIETNAPYIKTVQSWESFYNVSQPSESYGNKFFFSDELLNDGENTLIIEADAYSIIDSYSEEEPQPFTVHFMKIDENLIEYAYSKGKNYMAEDSPFVEPVTIFSNVENGLGIVSGYSVYSKTYNADLISKLMPEEVFSF